MAAELFNNSTAILPPGKFRLEKLKLQKKVRSATSYFIYCILSLACFNFSDQNFVNLADGFQNFCQNVSKSYFNRLYVSTSPVGIFRRVDGRGIMEAI